MSATFQAGLSTKDSKMEDKGYESPDRVLVFFFFKVILQNAIKDGFIFIIKP